MEQENEENIDWSTHVFRLESPCGRVYVVPLLAVRDDYVDFLVKEDGLTPEQAMGQVSLSDVKCWFQEQFNWDDVDAMGQCIKQPTAAQIQYALDTVRRHAHPSNLSKFEERAELVAARDARQLDQAAPKVSSAPPRRM